MNTISYPKGYPPLEPHFAGDIYMAYGSHYLLANYGPAGMALINLATGVFLRTPVRVQNTHQITAQEWGNIAGNTPLALVTQPITLTRIPT